MKLIHLSDLHLGKRLNEFSLLDDQEYILSQISDIIDSTKPDAVIIAGDIYDKSVPSAEAVKLFDKFLCGIADRKIQTFVISGNHDSAERIAFGSHLISLSGVHMSPVFNGKESGIKICNEYGCVNIYMLPFIKPANVRAVFENADITSYTDAVRTAIDNMSINPDERNVLITHQFVTGALRSESEEITVGGTDNVDASVFDAFDYTALGHIHNPQNISGKNKIRYCGTPLKYSFSEVNNDKSVTMVELNEKGNVKTAEIPLKPMRDMVEIRGKYNDITLKNFYNNTNLQDSYLHITLTDEDDIPNAISLLRTIYPYLLRLDYDNTRTKHNNSITADSVAENKSPSEIFYELFEKQNNHAVDDEQRMIIEQLIENIWEEKL